MKQAGWKLDEETHTLTIKGQKYRYFQSRRIRGKIKTVTIKRDSLGDLYIYLVTDAKDLENITRTGKKVGYDFGLKKFLTASDGEDVVSPLFFANNSKLIKQACRNLSRKAKDSNNRRRAKLNLARVYKKTANQRNDFHFTLVHRLCIEYETICIEDLNIKGMKRKYGRKTTTAILLPFLSICLRFAHVLSCLWR